MTVLEAIIMGIIQGITEFLPVSSSGHLALYQHFILGGATQANFYMSLVVHLGTLVAVCAAFRKTLLLLLKEVVLIAKDVWKRKFKWSEMNGTRRMLIMLAISTLVLVPFYIFLRERLEELTQTPNPITVGFCFLLTSFLLFMADLRSHGEKKARDITVANSIVVGLFQVVALLPGISRSGSTVSGGLFCGFNREIAVRYSFIMGIPAILGGCVTELRGAFDFADPEQTISFIPCAAAFVTAALVGLLAINLVTYVAKNAKFKMFAYYTLIIGVVVICAGFLEFLFNFKISDFFV